MKVYLDVSCLNRPFDDQSQPRIHLEAEAVIEILRRIDAARWTQVSSWMADVEVQASPDEARRRRVLRLLPEARIPLTETIFLRAETLAHHGLGAADAVHVAAAEALQADVFLTCDDRLLKQCARLATTRNVNVANPIVWLAEQDHATNT